MDWLQRTELLLKEDGLRRMHEATVVVAGVGGVGGYAAEMIVRSGVGHIVILDSDVVSVTNKNRQILALDSTVGLPKTTVLRSRLLDINPLLQIDVLEQYLEADDVASVIGPFQPDFVVDAIDTIAPKLALIRYCYENKIPSVSSMGAGARMDATAVRLADISKTYNCNLAAVIRKRLRAMGISKGVQVVFSEELPDREAIVPCQEKNKLSMVGSISYVPAVFGCICAQAAISGITQGSLRGPAPSIIKQI